MVKRQCKSRGEGNKRWKTIIGGGTAVKEDASAPLDFRAGKEWEFLSLPLELSNSLKCVLSPSGEAILYGAYNLGERGYAKMTFQGGLPGAVSLVSNRLIRQRAAVLSPSFVPFVRGRLNFLSGKVNSTAT